MLIISLVPSLQAVQASLSRTLNTDFDPGDAEDAASAERVNFLTDGILIEARQYVQSPFHSTFAHPTKPICL